MDLVGSITFAPFCSFGQSNMLGGTDGRRGHICSADEALASNKRIHGSRGCVGSAGVASDLSRQALPRRCTSQRGSKNGKVRLAVVYRGLPLD